MKNLEQKQSKSHFEATIEYIEKGQKVKSGYFFKKYHSLECDILYGKKKNLEKNIITNITDKETFIEKCKKIMNSSTIYDIRMFKESFKKIYNDSNDKYNFSLNDNFLSNIISKWKNNAYRFKKECVFYDTKDYENRLILRVFRLIPIETDNKEKNKYLEYIIWITPRTL